MAIIQEIKDGKFVDGTSDSSSKKKNERTVNNDMGKDQFLQLLVAQMQYQDPLEPTSNTEYISQLAQFSALEEMQNVSRTMDMQRASGLVGQEVYIKTVDPTTGNTDFVHGLVDFVSFQNGKAYVSVGGKTYPLDNVDSVYNPIYTEAYDLAYEWTLGLNKLPSLSKLTLDNKDDVMKLKEIYDKMTDYQKTFLTQENIEKFENYVKQIEMLQKLKDELDDKLEGGKDPDSSDKVEDPDKTDTTDKPDTSDKPDAADKPDTSDKPDATDKPDTSDKTDATDKTDSADKTQEAENAGAGQMPEETKDSSDETEVDEAGISVE